MANQTVFLKRSSGITTTTYEGKKINEPSMPSVSALTAGEMAINFADGYETIIMRNSKGKNVTFSNDNLNQAYIESISGSIVTEIVKNEKVVSTSLNELKGKINDVYTKTDTYSNTEVDNKLGNYATTTDVNSKLNGYLTTGTASSTYVKKVGDTMSGHLTVPSVYTTKIYGLESIISEGGDTNKHHRIDLGHSGFDHTDFYEYGGIWNFYKCTDTNSSSSTKVVSIESDGFHGSLKGKADSATTDSDGKAINTTYLKINGGNSLTSAAATITDGTEILTSYAGANGFLTNSSDTIVGKIYRRKASHLYDYIKSKTDGLYLGKTAEATSAAKATNDGSGRNIVNTYLTQTNAASTYLTQTSAKNTYATTANTYTKTDVDNKLAEKVSKSYVDDFSGSVLTVIVDNEETAAAALNEFNGYFTNGKAKNAITADKATQDGSGNVIADTYVHKTGDTMTGVLNGNEAVFQILNGTSCNLKNITSYGHILIYDETGDYASSSNDVQIELSYDGNITAASDITAAGDITAGGKINSKKGFFQTSDERLKTFHKDVDIDFNSLKEIPKKVFTWNDNPEKEDIGTSAQAVQKVYPELVNETNGTLSVDYAKLSIIALAAIDKLKEENDSLKLRIEALEKKLQD